MRRPLAVLLLLAFFLSLCSGALAASVQVDLTDFTLEMDSDAPCQTGKKAEGAVLFQTFPAYASGGDEFTRLSVTWTARELQIDSASQFTLAMYGTDVLDDFLSSMAASGITVKSSNLTAITAVQLGGRAALRFDIEAVVTGGAFGGTERTVYQRTFLAPCAGGCYLFSGLAADAASLSSVIDPIMATVRWH